MQDWVLALPAALQATGALMVVLGFLAMFTGFLAMFVTTMGVKCPLCGGDDKVKKACAAMTRGIIFIVPGLAALTACSWYGHTITQTFITLWAP